MAVDPHKVAARFLRANGASIYMQECLADARVVLLRLKKMVVRANTLVESSPQKNHIYEVAGDIVFNIPQVMADLERAIQGAALAAAKMDAAELEKLLPQREVKELQEIMERVPRIISQPMGASASSVLPGDMSGGGVPMNSQDASMFGFNTFTTGPRGYDEDFGGEGGGADSTDNPSFSRDQESEPAKDRERQNVQTVYYDGAMTEEDDNDQADGRTKPRYPYKKKYKPTKNAHEILVAFVERCEMEWEHKNRVALTLEALLDLRIDPDIVKAAQSYRPVLTRSMAKRNLWHFKVGDYVVRVRAMPKSASVKVLTSADIRLSCSCNAWRWQGPEYHAKEGGYLEGHPSGTASVPNIRDPQRVKPLCKHALATVEFLRKKDYPVTSSGRR